MNRIIATALALVAFTGASHADCASVQFQVQTNANLINNENSSFKANTAMMNASLSAGDIGSAGMYASMNKDAAIRMIGLISTSRDLLKQIDAEPDNCGFSDAQIRETLQLADKSEKGMKDVLAAFKNMN